MTNDFCQRRVGRNTVLSIDERPGPGYGSFASRAAYGSPGREMPADRARVRFRPASGNGSTSPSPLQIPTYFFPVAEIYLATGKLRNHAGASIMIRINLL